MPMVPCSWCETDTSRTCPICSRAFCSDHAAESDSELCTECGADPEQSIQVENKLTDVDGNSHEGRHLRPVGDFYITTAGEISQMSDEELERFYSRYSMLVRQCESALTRHQITHSMISLEREERARKSRKAKYHFTPEQIASVSAESPDRKLLIVAAMLKKAGVTKEKLKEMIEAKRAKQSPTEGSQEHAATELPNSSN